MGGELSALVTSSGAFNRQRFQHDYYWFQLLLSKDGKLLRKSNSLQPPGILSELP